MPVARICRGRARLLGGPERIASPAKSTTGSVTNLTRGARAARGRAGYPAHGNPRQASAPSKMRRTLARDGLAEVRKAVGRGCAVRFLRHRWRRAWRSSPKAIDPADAARTVTIEGTPRRPPSRGVALYRARRRRSPTTSKHGRANMADCIDYGATAKCASGWRRRRGRRAAKDGFRPSGLARSAPRSWAARCTSARRLVRLHPRNRASRMTS